MVRFQAGRSAACHRAQVNSWGYSEMMKAGRYTNFEIQSSRIGQVLADCSIYLQYRTDRSHNELIRCRWLRDHFAVFTTLTVFTATSSNFPNMAARTASYRPRSPSTSRPSWWGWWPRAWWGPRRGCASGAECAWRQLILRITWNSDPCRRHLGRASGLCFKPYLEHFADQTVR